MTTEPPTVAAAPLTPSNSGRDHALLAHMLERIAACGCSAAQTDRNCGRCPPATADACHVALTEVATEFMAFLIEHQRCEDEMMDRLPRTHANQAHCIHHRDAHVAFTSRYNKLAWRCDRQPPYDSIRTLEALIGDWIRQHALDFDARLIRLMEDSHGRG